MSYSPNITTEPARLVMTPAYFAMLEGSDGRIAPLIAACMTDATTDRAQRNVWGPTSHVPDVGNRRVVAIGGRFDGAPWNVTVHAN